jgi:fatty acid-binding protein DegV
MWTAVLDAANAANIGASSDAIRGVIQTTLQRTIVYLMVESLEHLRRNGRLGRAQALIGSFMDARPILTIADGIVTPVKTIHPRSKAIQYLRDLALERMPIKSLLVSASSLEYLAELETLFQGHYSGVLHQTWLGPTVGANTGPLLGIAIVQE